MKRRVQHAASRAAQRGALLILSLATTALLPSCSQDPAQPPPPTTPVTLSIPGFPPPAIPSDNPLTEEGITLGRELFSDPILSADNTLACAGCHAPEFSFTDHGERFSEGIDGLRGVRNTPPIINVAWGRAFFLDGRAQSLEMQALEPVTNPIEMHQSWEDATDKIAAVPRYREMFRLAFGDEDVTKERVTMAIAQFERTLVSNQSRYDRFLRGEVEFTPEELRGFNLFFTEKADCFHCHGNILLTDQGFHDVGLDRLPTDPGRAAVSGQAADYGRFKTPTLRNVALTAPYMHDARFGTLREVVDHYNSGGHDSPNRAVFVRFGTGLLLSEAQIADLLAFLHTFTDSAFVAEHSR